MKNENLSAVLLFLAAPFAVFAAAGEDRKIESAARASYNYRVVLEDHVKVSAADGVVTLTGQVQDNDDKELAEDTVANLPGVTAVKNNLTLAPTYPEHSDAWIALKIRTRLLVKGSVSAANTTVAVKDGIVTLGGTAANAAQRELTEIYAREVDLVRSVKNEMVIKDPVAASETLAEKMDDASITSQLKFALLRHKSTHALATKVSTTDGKISITGEASSTAEKALVTKIAEDVRGARSVTNNMTVRG